MIPFDVSEGHGFEWKVEARPNATVEDLGGVGTDFGDFAYA